MKIGVISDTHDQAEMIREAVKQLNKANVDLVIHCGDWISPFILQFFKGLKAPIKGVFGNNDGDKFRHLVYQKQFGLDITVEDRFLELELDGKKIAVFHGDYAGLVNALVKCGSYDVVLHGHTHQRVNERWGKTVSLNPGSLMQETSETVKGASIAIYDTAAHEAHHIMIH